MTASDPLHLVQLSLDPRQLAVLGLREKLPARQDDLEYLVHAHLAALFGESTIQPFRVMGQASRVQVLGYSAKCGDELREHAASFAEPADHSACDWSRFASKAMPESWAAGSRLGFEVRVCPVVRLANDMEVEGKDGEVLRYHRGAEVDAWVHRRFLAGAGTAVGRSEVYHDWLGDRLDGAACQETSSLEAFRRRRLVRKRQGGERKSRVVERPDVVMRGILTVTEGERFQQLLRRGIGRHKAFGFGMLLLRAPG